MAGTQQLFDDLVQHFGDRPGVTLPIEGAPRRFGSTALRVDGQIFAMLSRGQLTVKLPADRVRELIAGGTGGPFAKTETSTPWAEWMTVDDPDPQAWVTFAEEALAYVRG